MKLSVGMIVAVASLTVACAPPPPNHYSVAISPMFSADVQEAIVRGLDSWTAAVPELTLDVSVSNCGNTTVCVMPATLTGPDLGHTHTDGYGGLVQLDVPKIVRQPTSDSAYLVQQTTAHELGHVMLGREHSAAGTLMAATTSTATLLPTTTDITRWHKVR